MCTKRLEKVGTKRFSLFYKMTHTLNIDMNQNIIIIKPNLIDNGDHLKLMK